MRLFFAVDLSDSVRATIRQAIEDIPIASPPWRWVEPANLHITLKFLGEIPQKWIEGLADCAHLVCRSEPFSIRLRRLGGFPSLSRPRVLFYRAEEGAKPLETLAQELDRELFERLGIAREKRPFRAHLTIARIKQNLSPQIVRLLQTVPPLGEASQRVENLVLMKSTLRPEGAVYHPLKEFALSKSKC
ncbi:MAG: RNA 2',3'-cyclic phosphodiesterase [Candidatus Krumholzibacteria bacterium]|nr:RNA 2',3'-cyclic phosphodiesterase [Candidatus Krumholzibacteria bacterium]